MRLTPKQKELLDIALTDTGDPTWWMEGFPSEYQTAKSLERKGLIEVKEYNGRQNYEIRAIRPGGK